MSVAFMHTRGRDQARAGRRRKMALLLYDIYIEREREEREIDLCHSGRIRA